MISLTHRESIIWAAAFLDGEGWFGSSVTKDGYSQFQISGTQKDPELLLRLKRIFGVGNIYAPKKNSVVHKYAVTGANARGIMMMLYPFMSKHRKKQIQSAMSKPWGRRWRNHDGGC